MPGIPVRTVAKGGLPVVSVARGKGIPVTESDRGIPVTIAANGFGLPVYFESAAPPIDFDFQEFNMTAGQEGQWIGFSTGAPTTPQPAFGSISGQPTAVTNLLAFYDDTASGVFLAVFSGDYVDELQGLELAIGGFVVDSFEVQLISGNTWVRFTGIPGDLTPGSVYEVEFGWDLAAPAPEFITQPSISGSPQVDQVLTGSDGTGTNYTTYSRQWLRGTTAINGATGRTYTTSNDDVGFIISRLDTLTGTTAPPAVTTTNAIGPITAAPAEEWTFADIPSEYRTNGGLWEADNAVLTGTNQVSNLPDTWGVRDMVQATTGGQPFYGARNGYNAVVWPNTAGSRNLRTSGSFAPVYWLFIAEYNDAVRSTFLTFSALVGHNTTNGRIIGASGAATLVSTADSFWASELSKNAGAYSNTVLPMPMALLEAKGPASSGRWALGGVESNRAHQGPIWLAMALGVEPTGDLLAKIQGRAAWDYGLQGSLPVDHPFRFAPPTKGGPTALSASQSGNSFNFVQDGNGSPLLNASQSGNNFTFSE